MKTFVDFQRLLFTIEPNTAKEIKAPRIGQKEPGELWLLLTCPTMVNNSIELLYKTLDYIR